MIDFTNCPIDATANYGGSDKKRGIIYDNARYMLKLSDKIPDEKRNGLNSSYSNSAFSEYVSCHILDMLGYDVQQTLLGEITLMSSKGQTQSYPVVACKNFVPEGYELVEFKDIENALLTERPPKTPKLVHIYEILENENAYFSKELGERALRQYWDCFILDAFLGNFDRHANNWGYLVNKVTNKIEHFAPIYDCGSCLYPQLSDEAAREVLQNEEEIALRVDKFPVAALEVNGKKVSYKEYILSGVNKDCVEAFFRVYPKIDMLKIETLIDRMLEIPEIRRTFYKIILKERKERILDYSFEKIKYMSDSKEVESSLLIRQGECIREDIDVRIKHKRR